MKKKILIVFAVLAIVVPLGAKCTVNSDKSKNTGTCKQLVGGEGDACVTAGFLDSKNCDGNTKQASCMVCEI